MTTPLLSICIPTFNRLADLRGCLASIVDQVDAVPTGQVEVVIVSNASDDGTDDHARDFCQKHRWARFYRNTENFGFDGNTIKCFEHAAGAYVALLSDDDRYEPAALARILAILARQECALVLLNYYGYSPGNPSQQVFAPVEDREFRRGFDIMHYPSVGHFSGFIYHGPLARETLSDMRARLPYLDLSQPRLLQRRRVGVFGGLAARMTLKSKLPTFFVGTPLVAAQVRLAASECEIKAGVNKIREMCTDHYRVFRIMHLEGLLPRADLAFREKLALAQLPKALVRSLPHLTPAEARWVQIELLALFRTNRMIRWCWAPLAGLGRFGAIRWALRLAERPTRAIMRIGRRRVSGNIQRETGR